MRDEEVRAILERHGIDPDADAAALTTAIEAHGWVVRVELEHSRGRGHRYRGLARRPAPDIHPSLGILLHLSAISPARQGALVRVLAKILAREERPDPWASARPWRRER